MSRVLAVRLDDGTVVYDPDWRSVADVHRSYHAFLPCGGRVYGVIVDAETLVQVYPPEQPMDGMAGGKD